MQQKTHPGYYAVIPASVRYDQEVPMGAWMLYGEITALCSKEGYCWARNEYFSKLYGIHKNTDSLWVNKLKERGHIKTIVINTPTGFRRKIYPLNKIIEITQQKQVDPLNQNVATPQQKPEHINTMIITHNDTMNKDTLPPSVELLFETWKKSGLTNHALAVVAKQIKKQHTDIIATIEEAEAIKSIQNYATVLHSEEYFWSHRWTFLDFIARGLFNFMDENKPLQNYLKKNAEPEPELTEELKILNRM